MAENCLKFKSYFNFIWITIVLISFSNVLIFSSILKLNNLNSKKDRLDNLSEDIPNKFNLEIGKNFRDFAGLGYITNQAAMEQITEINKKSNKNKTKISNLFRRLFEEQGWEHVVTKTYSKIQDFSFTIIKNLKFKKMIFSFSGTRTLYQLTNQIVKSNSVPFKNHIRYIRLMRYFWDLNKKIKDDLQYYLKIHKNPAITQYIFTGHSLGGAIASVSLFDNMQENLLPRTSISPVLITYGSPRIGNYAFANELMKLIPIVFRIVNKYDLVPNVPMCEKIDRKCISEFGKKEFDKNFYDYKRIHDNLPNDKKEKFYPYHFGGLILVKDENNFMDCTTKSEVDENDPCSKGYLPFPKYHTTYFGSKISNTKNPLFSKYDNPIV